MLARDVAPDRIGRAKLEVESLLDELAGDRVGLVTFSTEGFVQMPLTTDYAAARTFLRQIDPRELPQGGTNLGAGLRAAQQLLASANDKGARTVLLFSDGEDWQGDAVDAAAALKKAGTSVYTVAVGTAAGAPITSASGRAVVTKMDPKGLAAVANAGGGQMWRGDGAIGGVAARLAAAQKSELEERRVIVYRERFQLAAAVGLALLAAATLLGDRRKRRARGVAAAAAMAVALIASQAHAGEWTRAPEPTTSAGVQRWRAGHYDEALQAFARAKAKGADAATIAYDRGTALYKLGRLQDARRELETASRGGGHVAAEASYALGDTLAKAGDTNGAMAAYRRALELEPQHADARHNLEVLLRKQDEQQQKQQPQQKDKRSQNQKQQQQQQNAQSQQKQQQQQQQNGQNQQKQQQQQNGRNEQKHQQQQNAQNQQKQQQQQNGQNQPKQQQQQQAKADSQQGQQRPLDRGGFGEPRSPEARRLLDSLQRDQHVLPVWRFGAEHPRRTDETDKDW